MFAYILSSLSFSCRLWDLGKSEHNLRHFKTMSETPEVFFLWETSEAEHEMFLLKFLKINVWVHSEISGFWLQTWDLANPRSPKTCKITGIFFSSEKRRNNKTQKNQHFRSFDTEFDEKCLRFLTFCWRLWDLGKSEQNFEITRIFSCETPEKQDVRCFYSSSKEIKIDTKESIVQINWSWIWWEKFELIKRYFCDLDNISTIWAILRWYVRLLRSFSHTKHLRSRTCLYLLCF